MHLFFLLFIATKAWPWDTLNELYVNNSSRNGVTSLPIWFLALCVTYLFFGQIILKRYLSHHVKNCHNPNSTTTQLKSWVWHKNDLTPPPPTTTGNSTSSFNGRFLGSTVTKWTRTTRTMISMLLLPRFWPNFKGWVFWDQQQQQHNNNNNNDKISSISDPIFTKLYR